jgi:hypothetical protein
VVFRGEKCARYNTKKIALKIPREVIFRGKKVRGIFQLICLENSAESDFPRENSTWNLPIDLP